MNMNMRAQTCALAIAEAEEFQRQAEEAWFTALLACSSDIEHCGKSWAEILEMGYRFGLKDLQMREVMGVGKSTFSYWINGEKAPPLKRRRVKLDLLVDHIRELMKKRWPERG